MIDPTLIAFVTERAREDEYFARGGMVADGSWRCEVHNNLPLQSEPTHVTISEAIPGWRELGLSIADYTRPNDRADGELIWEDEDDLPTDLPYGQDNVGAFRHIERWDPARVLREVRLREWLIPLCGLMDESVAHAILSELALVHADHPHFDESWVP